MKNIYKSKNGVTLIALVVTVIVLIILAGVSLSMLPGNHGILKRATEVKQDNDRIVAMEELQQAILPTTSKPTYEKSEVLSVITNLGGTYTADGMNYNITYKGFNFILDVNDTIIEAE